MFYEWNGMQLEWNGLLARVLIYEYIVKAS